MLESPERYYAELRIEKADGTREPGALTVMHLNRSLKRRDALMAVSIAILEVKQWFNVKGNMTDRQVKMTAEMILDHPHFYDLSLGNIKACFRERMMEEKLYDRLDGNIIIGWLRKFKSDMADACYEQRTTEDRLKEAEDNRNDGLEKRALDLLSHLPTTKRYRTKEEQEQWRRDFMRYKAERLIRKLGKEENDGK